MSEWIKQAVFYHIYPIGFCGAPTKNNEEPLQHRILKIKELIPHLSECGINAIYLGPVFESSEHGYDTKDYFKIDTRLGDEHSFKEVCDSLHEAGIKVVLDGVFNHVGREFWAFKDVQQKKWDSPYCDWFMNLNFNGHSPMGDDFWYEGWNGHYNLVKLNLRNPDVCDMLIKAVFYWMDTFHINGLRLDAADVMDRDFFKRLRSEVKNKDPEFWLMGEVIHGDYKLWINDQMLDSTTNYECYKGLYSSHNDENYFEIAHSFNRQFSHGGIYEGIYLYNFTDNHDVNRLASTLRDESHLYNVYTLLFTMPGIPSIYYGSEMGIKGIKERWSDEPLRPCIPIEDFKMNELSRHIAKLAEIKKSSPALASMNYEQICIRNKQFVFKRSCEQETLFTAANLEHQEISISFRFDEPLTDLLTMQTFEPENGQINIILEPTSAMILSNRQIEKVKIKKKITKEEKPQQTYRFIEEIESLDNHQIFYIYEDEQHHRYLSAKKF